MFRILPPTLFTLLMVMIALCGMTAALPLAPSPAWPLRGAGIVILLMGGGLMGWANSRFQRNNAEINTFEQPRNLVTDGPFRFSRNPMYLAFTILLLGAALLANSAVALLAVAGFFAVAHWCYVPFEEANAKANLGAPYLDYAARVRRWL